MSLGVVSTLRDPSIEKSAGQTKERSLVSKGQYQSSPRMHQRWDRRADVPSIRRATCLRRLVRVGATNRNARILVCRTLRRDRKSRHDGRSIVPASVVENA